MKNYYVEIKNLENELTLLREKQRVQNICASIEKKASARDNAVKSEVDDLMMTLSDYKMKIDDKAEDLVNIRKVAITLRENGYRVPTHFTSSRIYLELHNYTDEEPTAELKILNNRGNASDGYLLIKTNGNLSDDDYDYSIRCSVIDAINRGVWDRGMTNSEKTRFLKQDIDLMQEYLTNYDLFLSDFYNYAENV